MNIICNGFHSVREFFRVRNKTAGFVPVTEGPAVVDNQVLIAGVAVTAVDHEIRHFTDQLIGNVFSESIPGVPAKRGTGCKHNDSSLSKWGCN